MIATAPQEILAPVQEETSKPFTLEDFVTNPPQDMEWVDGELVEKTGMTVKHSIAQGNIVTAWNNHATAHEPGGKALPEAPCRTQKQGRRPDCAYLPAPLFAQFNQVATVPQSYPLIAEVASPTDYAEELFAKAIEYLESGCEEVWLVFPEAKLIMVKTSDQSWQVFNPGQTIATQKVLNGFEIAVDQLFA
ncbi:Uma2 family endonuclease [Cyanobacteria bacterium FACHB-63]|nr:Uma2 family endonuclease [Cyanobacteria bacterium FACHB-63]